MLTSILVALGLSFGGLACRNFVSVGPNSFGLTLVGSAGFLLVFGVAVGRWLA